MKKIYFILLLSAVTIGCMAQNIGEAFYIYRDDGEFNAFFRDEVLSIEYSNYDLDSVYHDDVVVQDVYTQDSIYRIPLAVIDSVGFHTPAPIFQPDVKIMNSEWVPYIINVQDSLIVFSKNIPSTLCPNMGDVLVSEYPNTDFPLPFSGRVIKIENTTTELKCVCKDVEIVEIYKRLIFIGKTITESNSSSRLYSHKRSSGIVPVTIDRNKLNKKFTIDEIDDFKFSLELDPQVELQYYMLIDEDARSIYRVKASTKTSLQLEMDIVLDTPDNKPKESFFRKQEEISNILKRFKIPVEFPILTGVTGFIELRPFFELNAEVSAGLGWSFTLSTIDDVYKDYNGNIRHKSINKEFTPQPPTVQASLSGDVFGGLGIKLGLGGIKKNISSAGVDVKTGFVLNGDAHFSFSPFDDYDTTIYDAFKESKISLNGRIEAIPFFTVLKYDSENSSNVFKFSMDFEIGSWNLFPEFNNLVYNMKGNTLNIQIDANKRLLLPAKVGVAIFDDVENVVDEYYQDYPYWLFSQLFQEEKLQLEHNFNIKAGKKYKCYPVVQLKWGDHYFGKIKASPNADIENIFPVAIADYEQTSARYSKAAFTHKGANYDFSYGASVTASITSTNNVEDWGYVYEDLNGDTAHVSLKAFESPYTDTRYSYYRNEPESYATLYGYVKYVGDDNFYHGEKTDYPLIYDKQPEAFTLEPTMIEETFAKVMCKYKEAAPWGGTCGVEYWEDLNINNTKKIYFDTAEEEIEITLTDLKPGTDYYYQAFIMIGDEYIMDETEDGIKLFTTKQEQPKLNLCPDNNHPHLIDLGLPSGTKWACCNVGASKPEEYGEYYMYGQVKNAPSIEQFRELINKCSYQWINYNGINGNLFIGSNGQSIFMPAGGKYFNTGQLGLLYVGEFGVYWSSSPWIEEGVLNTDKMASPFEFSEQHVAADCWDMREDGLSVRSVDSGIKVKTGDATDINTTSTTLNGTVENLELATESVTLAFLYSTSENILNSSDCKTVEVANDSEGNLTTQISDLHDYTTYYYAAAYKLGEADYVLGEVKSFTTSVNVTTIDSPETTIISATLQGICTKGVSIAGFSVKKNGDTEYTQYDAYPDENGNFSATIDGLDIETRYVFYAFAQANDQTYEGEEFSFTTKSLCPDNHHPHMIDLGLPSGTKWACCNVGASKPEEYGGYYAWGETTEKDWYSWKTYSHAHVVDYNSLDPYYASEYFDDGQYYATNNIGNDISGTQYDAARVNWGEPWRLPSFEECEALVNGFSKWTVFNDINGRLFIGPNGNAIFLPAASGRWNDVYDSLGSWGYYQSGTLKSDTSPWPPAEHDLNFTNYMVHMGYWAVYNGKTVRPVSK